MISLTEIAIITSNYLVLSKFTTIAHSANTIPFKYFIWKYRRDCWFVNCATYISQTDSQFYMRGVVKEMVF